MNIPNKKALEKNYLRSNLRSKIFFYFELLLIGFSLSLLNFKSLSKNPSECLIIIGIALCPTLLSILYSITIKKKLVEDLKPETRFGSTSKQDLLGAINSVCLKSKIDKSSVSFYITASKNINAAALHLGLGNLFKPKRLVYLNRATIHNLLPDELESVIAHELAHLFKYQQGYHKHLIFHVLVSTIFALAIFANFPEIWISIIAIFLFSFLAQFFTTVNSREIEFLCDGFGAEIAGLPAALRAEYKIGLHSEQISNAFYIALESKLNGNTINLNQVQEIIEDSLSYDGLSKETLEKEVRNKLENKNKKDSANFLSYLKTLYLWEDPSTESNLQEEFRALKKIQTYEKVAIADISFLQYSVEWFEELINRAKNNPKQVLFKIPEEISGDQGTHPSTTRRIAYLLENYGKHLKC